MFEPIELANDAIIKVIGIGGGGGNAVEHMMRTNIEGVEFFAVNTDLQALKKIEISKTIQIGKNVTKGLGAGANPEIGRNSAEEDREILRDNITGSDMLFIAAGMGGGTGTGAAPVLAEISKNLGILTVAVVTKPFHFEGKKRMSFAESGIIELSKYVDSLIVIPNDKLLKTLNKGISFIDAFSSANDVLKSAVQSISELITKPGIMNVDFADVRTVMSEMGYAMMGSGISSGEKRAEEAVETAISSPLLEDINLSSAKGILVNINAGFDLRLDEFEIIGNTINSFSSENTTLVIGTSIDPNINNEMRVTVIATGIVMNKKLEFSLEEEKKSNGFVSNNIYYNNVERDFFLKEKKVTSVTQIEKNKKKNKLNYLDIPAFLRKKKIK